MKPELVAYLRHIRSAQGLDTSLRGAFDYFKTLTPAAVVAIVSREVAGIDDEQQLYNNIQTMLGKLIWQHGPYWTIHQYIPPELTEVNMSTEKTAYLKLVGDAHGHYDRYAHIVSSSEYSLQVGDMGFDYRYLTRVVPADTNKIIAGNHDNYTKTPCLNGPCPECQGKGYTYGEQSKHFLGDYGVWQPPEFCPIFYFRGAWSIDYKYRTPEISWWEDEEVPYQQMLQAFDFYKAARPEFVVTHTCPFSIVSSIPFDKIFGDVIHKPRTEEMLEQLYQEWQPTWWIFGHWHKNWTRVFEHPRTGKKTKFVCLAELASMNFPKNFAGTEILDLQPVDFGLK